MLRPQPLEVMTTMALRWGCFQRVTPGLVSRSLNALDLFVRWMIAFRVLDEIISARVGATATIAV